MTGDVYNDKGIEDRHDLLNMIYQQMSASPKTIHYTGNEKETQNDEEIIRMAENAVNGSKFSDLRKGNWNIYYQSQSEADFSYIDMLAFYTQNRNQIYRLFKASHLGIRDKSNRSRLCQWNDNQVIRSLAS